MEDKENPSVAYVVKQIIRGKRYPKTSRHYETKREAQEFAETLLKLKNRNLISVEVVETTKL